MAEFLKHPIATQPIVGATLTLRRPNGEMAATAVSGPSGDYELRPAEAGLFVLRIEGGDSGEAYDTTHLVVRLTPNAARDVLSLRRPVMGFCGSRDLVPDPR